MVAAMLRGYAGKIWLISGAGLVARLALLAYQPLWRDEAFTALAVQRPLGAVNRPSQPFVFLGGKVDGDQAPTDAIRQFFP